MRDNYDLAVFAEDLYNVLGMNKNFCTQKQFFEKYVEDDNAFMVSDEGDKQCILFDDYTITIKKNKK